MAHDETLEALGKLARQQEAEIYPIEPLSPEMREAMTDRALAALLSSRPAPVAKVLTPKFGWRRAVTAAVPLALAASVALLVWSPWSAQQLPLPAYGMTVTGGIQELRGETSDVEPLVVRPSSRIELVLQPQKAVEGAVRGQLFVVQGGKAREWTSTVVSSPQGAVRIVALGTALAGVEEGDAELVAVVSRDGVSEDAAVTVKSSDEVQALRRPARWLP